MKELRARFSLRTEGSRSPRPHRSQGRIHTLLYPEQKPEALSRLRHKGIILGCRVAFSPADSCIGAAHRIIAASHKASNPFVALLPALWSLTLFETPHFLRIPWPSATVLKRGQPLAYSTSPHWRAYKRLILRPPSWTIPWPP
jgi:hypothetical protein